MVDPNNQPTLGGALRESVVGLSSTWGDERLHAEFWSKVVLLPGSCWGWIAGKNSDGYGSFTYQNKGYGAHRFAYLKLKGDIPEGRVLDHLCRVRRCVNPDHLEPVTDKVNILRGYGRAAIQSRRTVCPNGHPLSGENLVPSSLKHGRRNCATCLSIRSREQGAWIKAAHELLGLTQKEYKRKYGHSYKTAKKLVEGHYSAL